MARSREFDDAEAVSAARDVFWERGYASTSLVQLQAATGLSKSSLYETYGSKRELFQRAVEDYLASIIAPQLAPLERVDAGADEVAGWFLAFAARFRDSPERQATRGCLMLNTATDLPVLDASAAAMLVEFNRRVRAAFGNAAREMAVADPADFADLLTVQHIGVITMSRMDRHAATSLAERFAAEARTFERRPRRRSGPSAQPSSRSRSRHSPGDMP